MKNIIMLFSSLFLLLSACNKGGEKITFIDSPEFSWSSRSKELRGNIFLKHYSDKEFEYNGVNKISELSTKKIIFYTAGTDAKDSVEMVIIEGNTLTSQALASEVTKIEARLGKSSGEKKCLTGPNKSITRYWTTDKEEHIFLVELPDEKKYGLTMFKNPTSEPNKIMFEAALTVLRDCQ